MIQPTIGRVIWFVSATAQAIEPDLQPWPAFVCRVHDDRLVNVAGFMANGETFRAENVQLLQDDDKTPADTDFAMWMPYQVTAAAKEATPATAPATAPAAPPA